MAWFLMQFTPSRATFPADASEDELDAVDRHFDRLERLTGSGVIVLVGRTQEDSNPLGLCVFEAADDAAGRAFARDDPAVQAGVFRAQVRSYRVALGDAEALRRALAQS